MSLDFGDVWAVADNLEAVTVRQIDPDTGATLATATGVTALRRAAEITTGSPDGDGSELPKVSLRWHLDAADLTFVPKKRDKVVDAVGVAWCVERVTVAANSARYACECVKV